MVKKIVIAMASAMVFLFSGLNAGAVTLALDSVQAGVGDTVLVIDEGNSSRMIVGDPMAPIRTMVVGIVDQVDVGGEK